MNFSVRLLHAERIPGGTFFCLFFWAIALAAQTPKFLILCRNDTAAHLNQPRLLGLEPPARAGHRSNCVLPAALRCDPRRQV